MSLILFRGRTPAQFLDALIWRINLFRRRFFLSILRWAFSRREAAWIERRPQLSYVLNSDEVRSILESHPGAQAETISEAERALSGWTDVPQFGRREIDLILESASSPEEAYAFRLLSRLDFLRPLVRASLIADDKSAYIVAVENYLLEWERGRGRRRRWNSVDEAIRVLNLVETLALLHHKLKSEAYQAGLRCLLSAAWAVQADRTRTGNHLIYEGLALFYAGTCLSGYFIAERWRRLGHRILEKAMRQQVGEDGMNAELSTNYHLITGTNFLKGWVLGKKTGCKYSDLYTQRLAEMALVAQQLRAHDGGFFALGDSDRMAGSSREEREAGAFAELGRISIVEVEGAAQSSELEFLLAGLQPGLVSKEKETAGRNAVSTGGYQILRGAQGQVLVFDAGIFGLPGASHHGHTDSLSFEVHLPDGRFLVDPGGFSYVDERARAFARSTAAHNTVRIDGKDSSEIIGSFAFGRGARARLLDFKEIASGFILTAEHDGYTRLPSPVIHRRALLWLIDRPLLLLVVDHLMGRGRHAVEAFFHADHGWEARLEGQDRVEWLKDQHRIIQVVWSAIEMSHGVYQGENDPRWQGWVSPAFGQFIPAPTLVESCEAELPLDIVNIFCETGDSESSIELDGLGRTVRIDGNLKLSWDWSNGRLAVDLN